VDLIGRYELRREIGRGGMATVYLGHDPRFERDVAIKLLPREFLHDPSFRARFEREAKAIASLEHPAIVPVYDFGEESGQPFLVMRYMAGGTLKDRLRAGPLALEEIFPILRRVAVALDEAHAQGFVHRDVKPDNILFDQRGEAYLSDFGIVKLAQETTTFTGSGVVGTPAYMSPEQARGEAHIDGRTDVYALGCILFELLTGQPPYDADTPMGLAVKHITEPVPSLREVAPQFPQALDEAVARAMAKDRTARFESAGEFVATVEAAAVPSQPVEVSDELAAAPDGEAPTVGETIAAPPSGSREKGAGPLEAVARPTRWLRLVGLALGVVLALAAGILLFNAIPPILAPPQTPTPTVPRPNATPPPEPTLALPAVEGPEPSTKVAAFYYPWYGNPDFDGQWIHWEGGGPGFRPPLDISSDFYPVLGPYSANDPVVVAQHLAWLREAGVGLIVSSWWGRYSFEDQALPLLLDQAERYGIKVAIHIEPYGERSGPRMLEDIQYLYQRYGGHPAFYRTTDFSPWAEDDRSKGLFFVFGPDFAGEADPQVSAEYWKETLDAIHALPDGAIVLAATTDCSWVESGHFDGLYNYLAVHAVGDENAFSWSRCIPRGAWYVPSVAPGSSPRRIGYPDDLYEPRREGGTYSAQWDTALGTGVEPRLVTITSFNEWHEGTQIEPAAYGVENGLGYTYDDYGPVGEQGYLTLTREWADRLLLRQWPEISVMRIHMTTRADWTSLLLLSGGTWIRPELIFASEEATNAGTEENRINLNQTLDRAKAGEQVDLLIDISLLGADPDGQLAFEIQRGSIGWTKVEIFNFNGPDPVLVDTFIWGGLVGTDGLNPYRFKLPAASVVGPPGP
jgi:serine/threonine protein kinase